jgi:hypothetical protein
MMWILMYIFLKPSIFLDKKSIFWDLEIGLPLEFFI